MLPVIRFEMGRVVRQSIRESGVGVPAASVAIHYRCGDILRSGHRDYGLLAHSYYAQTIAHLNRTALRGRPLSALLVTNNQTHSTKNVEAAACGKLLDALARTLRRAGVGHIAVASTSSDQDFATLVTARYMIGAISTFSFWAALSRSHGIAIMPKRPLFLKGAYDVLSNALERDNDAHLFQWQAGHVLESTAAQHMTVDDMVTYLERH